MCLSSPHCGMFRCPWVWPWLDMCGCWVRQFPLTVHPAGVLVAPGDPLDRRPSPVPLRHGPPAAWGGAQTAATGPSTPTEPRPNPSQIPTKPRPNPSRTPAKPQPNPNQTPTRPYCRLGRRTNCGDRSVRPDRAPTKHQPNPSPILIECQPNIDRNPDSMTNEPRSLAGSYSRPLGALTSLASA